MEFLSQDKHLKVNKKICMSGFFTRDTLLPNLSVTQFKPEMNVNDMGQLKTGQKTSQILSNDTILAGMPILYLKTPVYFQWKLERGDITGK